MNTSKYLILFCILLCFGCQHNKTVVEPLYGKSENGKPDLLITHINYTRLSSATYGEFGEIIVTGPRFEFSLEIKNIGNASITNSFYISYTTSNDDFEDQYCSQTIIVNDPPTYILAGESKVIKFTAIVEDSIPNILIVLNTNNRFDRGVPLPIIDEISYENNSSIVSLNW